MSKLSKSTNQYLNRKWPLSSPPNNPRHLWLGLRYGAAKAAQARWSWKDGE